MNYSIHDDRSQKRSQELDQLERDARTAGQTAKKRHLDEKRVMSEEAQVAFATGIVQLHLQKYIDHLDADEITLYALLYLSFFRDGYKEVKPSGGAILPDFEL